MYTRRSSTPKAGGMVPRNDTAQGHPTTMPPRQKAGNGGPRVAKKRKRCTYQYATYMLESMYGLNSGQTSRISAREERGGSLAAQLNGDDETQTAASTPRFGIKHTTRQCMSSYVGVARQF